jgi:CDP-2,3-bis-(O-geranylgeranyl)-sn-glycerol synthase
MFQDIFIAFWFFIPAGAANVAPIFAAAIPGLKRFSASIDGGKKLNGRPILGANKTWRGIVVGIIAATLMLWLQQLIVGAWPLLHDLVKQIDYQNINVFVLGFLFAIGALGGDIIESFFKRRLNIGSGHTWFPFDQIDYILGGIITTMPLIALSLYQYLWLIILWTIIHLLSAFIGWLLGFKPRPI